MSKQLPQSQKQYQQLTKLRQHLEELSSIPSAQDEEMLTIIISDAHKGIDITQEYPAFYEELLHNAQLRQLFLEALEISDTPADVDPTPITVLPQEASTPHWRIVWQRTAAQLQTIFMPPPAAQPSRADTADTQDETFILLHSTAEIEHIHAQITLTAGRNLEDEAHLHLTLFVESFAPYPFKATLTWGQYQETISLSANTPAAFPLVPLTTILSEDGETFLRGLDLSLEPA